MKQQLHAKKRGECLAHPWINYKEEEKDQKLSKHNVESEGMVRVFGDPTAPMN